MYTMYTQPRSGARPSRSSVAPTSPTLLFHVRSCTCRPICTSPARSTCRVSSCRCPEALTLDVRFSYCPGARSSFSPCAKEQFAPARSTLHQRFISRVLPATGGYNANFKAASSASALFEVLAQDRLPSATLASHVHCTKASPELSSAHELHGQTCSPHP